jgi:hypothetical protein
MYQKIITKFKQEEIKGIQYKSNTDITGAHLCCECKYVFLVVYEGKYEDDPEYRKCVNCDTYFCDYCSSSEHQRILYCDKTVCISCIDKLAVCNRTGVQLCKGYCYNCDLCRGNKCTHPTDYCNICEGRKNELDCTHHSTNSIIKPLINKNNDDDPIYNDSIYDDSTDDELLNYHRSSNNKNLFEICNSYKYNR